MSTALGVLKCLCPVVHPSTPPMWSLWHLIVLVIFHVLGCSQGMPPALFEAGYLCQHLDLDVVVG